MTIAQCANSPFLDLDCAAETKRIETFLNLTTARRLNRRGLVLGVSGGIDSAVCAALAARAVGPSRVLALLMPESDASDDEATNRARRLCESLGIRHEMEDISASLDAIGCYRRRDEALLRIFPDYQPDWRHKIVIGGGEDDQFPHFDIVVEDKEGRRRSRRLPPDAYLQIVASTNFKQRIRKAMEYHHAERLNYAVLGTPNRLEYELGFFVRGGDGLADIKPIAHLYKTQVYALAAYLDIPEEIRRQPPSTDTYSLPQTQEEFYFALSYDRADLVLAAMNNGLSALEAAKALNLPDRVVARAYRDFEGKRRVAARALRSAYLIDEAP